MRFRICACTETSRAETGSSATTRSGFRARGPGEANSLALAAAELVRVAVGVLGAQAHGLQQPAHLDPQRFPFRPL